MPVAQEEEIQSRLQQIAPKLQKLVEGLNRVILDKEQIIEQLVTGILAEGHVLLEGLPGLGKTELVKGFAQLCSIDFKRVQFTPDLLPSDITGSLVLQEDNAKRGFVFQPGPVFANILLCDEINRASPKTQSALLEAMQERSVTVMGETHKLPNPFFVVATQNPIEMEGTYPLPEAQVDRFLFKLHLGRASENVLRTIVRERINGAPPDQEPVMTLEELREAISLAREVYMSEAVAGYIARLVEATHADSESAPPSIKRYVRYGGSPRAAIALGGAARARALLHGRHQAGFEDVKCLFAAVANHRLILDYTARMDGVDVHKVMDELLASVSEYSKPLPAGMSA